MPVLTNARYEMFAQELAECGELENSENLRGNAMDTTTTYSSFAPPSREQARAAEAAARKHSVARTRNQPRRSPRCRRPIRRFGSRQTDPPLALPQPNRRI